MIYIYIYRFKGGQVGELLFDGFFRVGSRYLQPVTGELRYIKFTSIILLVYL